MAESNHGACRSLPRIPSFDLPGADNGQTFLTQCREEQESLSRRMTSTGDDAGSDVTLMFTASDGAPWARYLSEKLNAFPKVTHTRFVLDEQDYENPPELALLCRGSCVTVLLATPGMCSFLRDKEGWLPAALGEVPPASSVVLLLLVDKQEVEEVSGSYDTSRWTYLQVGKTTEEVRRTLAQVLDLCERAKRSGGPQEGEGEREEGEGVAAQALEAPSAEAGVDVGVGEGSPKTTRVAPTTAPKPRSSTSRVHAEFFPSTVYESGTRVALVFKEEVRGEVTLKVDKTDMPISVQRLNSTVFTFALPTLSPGKYNVLVFSDDKRLRCRPELTVRGAEQAFFSSPHYLKSCLGLGDLQELDVMLKDLFNKTLPADKGLDKIFANWTSSDSGELQMTSDAQYPTLLHYAAAYGLSEFCAALLECPGSQRAFHVRNCEGDDPAQLAERGGFEELENYIIDFMDMQAANDVYGDYIAMNPSEDQADDQDNYEDMQGSPTDHETDQDNYEDMQGMEEIRSRLSSDPFPLGRTPNLPVRPPAPDPLDQGASQSWSEDAVFDSRSSRPERPPLPPPRVRAQTGAGLQRVESERQAVAPALVPRKMSSTLPHGNVLDAAAFMGMTGPQAGFQPALPKGAMGSRGQGELIEVNEMVKNKEININEAEMLYRNWHQRFGKNNNTSFKDRQRELSEIKGEYQQVREKQQASKSGAPSKSFFSRLGKSRQQTIKLNISDPVLQRQTKKTGPKVYTKSFSAGSFPQSSLERASTLSNTSSNASSRDSGWSQGSRDSTVSGLQEPEAEGEVEDVTGQEVTSRSRKGSSASQSNRKSLGHQYLQQVQETEAGAQPPPPLPPRNTHPTPGPRYRGSTDSTA